jgi:hypothetical protein
MEVVRVKLISGENGTDVIPLDMMGDWGLK